jgi:F0F1-type ATP synthase delta subunit|tara:strand:+ start:279 stop:527 length:249 start_codon:yes stop_codon:yes gene_type:complete
MNGDIMSISKDDLLKRREEIVTDYNNAVAEIAKGESQIKEMKNNLNALAGALQQTDLFLKQIEEDGDEMPPEKKFALDMATS